MAAHRKLSMRAHSRPLVGLLYAHVARLPKLQMVHELCLFVIMLPVFNKSV